MPEKRRTSRAALSRARYRVRTWVSTSPSIYLPLMRRKYGALPDRLVRPDTRLVIEGFQRSGNTFAAYAFETSQPHPVRVAHHLHAAAQVEQAVRLGIPTLVLIRNPEDSVLSHMIRLPYVSAKLALENWIRFYTVAVRRRASVVVASFPEVTGDFGAVIERVNRRFGTDFTPFRHSEENVASVFTLIEARNRDRFGTLVEGKVARPSEERRTLKEQLRAEYRADPLAPRRRRAEGLYRSLVPVDPGGPGRTDAETP